MTYASVGEHFAAYMHEFGFTGPDHVLSRYADATNWRQWGAARRALACDQVTFRWTGIDSGAIDGLDGPQTQAARAAWTHWNATRELPSWRDGDPSYTADPIMPTKRDWPRQVNCSAFYGAPGYAVERQLVYVECPWTLRLAWQTSTSLRRFKMHAKCADATAEVLERVHGIYGEAEIKRLRLDLWGGSYNLRRMRGGSSWSMHAYGCAIDWDPARNALNARAPAATLSHAEYVPWWEAWEAAGATSLGRARNYDWMHVQFADLP
jgi:hypothetical protein